MMRLHIICGALLIGFCAHAQQKQPAEKQQTVKLKVPPLPPNTEAYLTAQLADAKWAPVEKLDRNIPRGAEEALIGAEPLTTGITAYLRMKPGYKLPAHGHTHTTWYTMLAGKGTWTIDGKKTPSTVGTFVVAPSKATHEFTCDPGAECVFLMRRSGPTDYIWPAK
jgi:mannose-6-phosphate isomerase-like protein (cupin superfamily)